MIDFDAVADEAEKDGWWTLEHEITNPDGISFTIPHAIYNVLFRDKPLWLIPEAYKNFVANSIDIEKVPLLGLHDLLSERKITNDKIESLESEPQGFMLGWVGNGRGTSEMEIRLGQEYAKLHMIDTEIITRLKQLEEE